MIPPIIDLPDDLERLRWYQAMRAAAEENARVQAILAKPAKERTDQEWTVLAYSPFGYAASCGC